MFGTFNEEDSSYHLVLKEKFNFESEPDFRNCMSDVIQRKCTSLNIDMEKVTYIDSAALSLLVLARKKGEEAGFDVVLSNVAGAPKQIIQTVGFDQMFTIK